jgi:hypothetical protein
MGLTGVTVAGVGDVMGEIGKSSVGDSAEVSGLSTGIKLEDAVGISLIGDV